MSQETELRKTIEKVLPEYASRFDDARFFDEKIQIISR